VCFGALKWLERHLRVLKSERKKLKRGIKINLNSIKINFFISHSPNAAFQGQWKPAVAGNKTIQLILTASFYSFDLIHAGCGPVNENTFRSPGYPNDYPNNTDCISSFPIPQGMVINITINELYLEESISCE